MAGRSFCFSELGESNRARPCSSQASQIRKIIPLGDRVLVKRVIAEAKVSSHLARGQSLCPVRHVADPFPSP